MFILQQIITLELLTFFINFKQYKKIKCGVFTPHLILITLFLYIHVALIKITTTTPETIKAIWGP